MFHNTTSLISRFSMSGVLTVRMREIDSGRIFRTIIKKNTIVNGASAVVLRLLLQETTDTSVTPASSLQLGSMRFGTSIVATSPSDSNLTNEIVAVRKQLGDTEKTLVGTTMTLTATLDGADAPGSVFSEVGLFTKGATWDGTISPTTNGLFMFARQVHAPITKSTSFAFDYSWTIQISLN